jgi:hypothetical protein
MLPGVLARKKGPRRGCTKLVSEANHCNHLSNLKVCQNQIWECIRYFCRNELKRDSHRIARVRSPVNPCGSPFRPSQWVGPTVDAGEGLDVCEWRRRPEVRDSDSALFDISASIPALRRYILNGAPNLALCD